MIFKLDFHLEKFKEAPLIKESFVLLTITGMNPLKQNLLSKTVAFIIFLVILTVAFELILEVVQNWKGLNSMFSIGISLGFYQILSKALTLMLNRRKITNLLSLVKLFWQFNPEEDLRSEVEDTYNLIRMIFKSGFFGVIFANLTFVIMPFLFKSLMFKTYHPRDIQKSPDYEIMYFLQCFAVVGGSIVYFGFELLFMFFIVCVVCEFQILREKIRLLPKIFKKIQDEIKLLKELSLIIDQHNFVLSCINELNDCYSMMILNHTLTSVFCLSATMLTIIVQGMADLPELVRLILFAVDFMGLFFIYCLCGQVLTTACEGVLDGVLESNWWQIKEPNFRKALVLIIQRAQKLERITAAGMFDLNLTTFTRVVNGAFSYSAVFQAVYSKDS